jgi:diaminopimelate epimerase
MKFTKMHGCGNDYVYVNGFEEHIPDDKKSELAISLSNRNFGIGSDGLIFINPGKTAEFEMEMYNADGSRSEMCGNGIRCVGKYIYDHGLSDKTQISVESAGAVKYLTLFPGGDGKIEKVRVNMGSPILESKLVPVMSDNEKVIDEAINVSGNEYKMTCVSMGNPHAVVFMNDVKDLDIEKIGPCFENHERFPRRTNTEFVEVLDRSHVFMRVWERGTGETLACGTGCCATAVACILNGLTDEKVNVKVLGGNIEIEWDRNENVVFMTGPAKVSFEGDIKI